MRQSHLVLFVWFAVAAGACATVIAGEASVPTVVDACDQTGGWSAHPADGVELVIRSDRGAHGLALRLDFRFLGGGGYAVARKAFALDLPENYAFTFRIRGAAPRNALEFKLIDSTGENVWWSVRRDVQFPAAWETWTIKKRQIQFAWGPQGGGDIRHVAAIEFAITAGSGGAGTVWIDDLELRSLAPPGATPPVPVANASSAQPAHGAALAVDGDSTTAWWSTRGDTKPWLGLDLGESREFGGLSLDWGPGRHALDYVVEVADEDGKWRTLRSVRDGNGGHDDLWLPESEARRLRLRVLRRADPAGVSLGAITLQPLAWGATREAFFAAVARRAPRGSFPRGISGEQPFWTVVGVDDDPHEGLFDEDGRLEPRQGGFAVEPLLAVADRLATWSDVQAEQSLAAECLPIPSVHWKVGDLGLVVTAFATGPPGASAVVGRYRVTNHGTSRVPVTLYLALRPFQVDPPSQFLNVPGGTAHIGTLAFEAGHIQVDGERAVVPLSRPAHFGAVAFDSGDIVADFLRAGRIPERQRVQDPFAAASGVLAYPLDLAPGAEQEVDLWFPLAASATAPVVADDAAALDWVAAAFERCASAWKARLERVAIELPDSAAAVVHSLRSQQAYILVERAGPALQPGARSYARSWIRDGALTSSALLRLGEPGAVRAFIDWYAPHQYANGKIPCVVDARGADPVPEHDSSGEFVFLIAEYHRYIGDRAFLESMYPRVTRAVAYLDSLRQERRTAEYRAPEKAVFFGLLPPSISHEGYSAKPMHSYWDDFWALRGFRDAAWLAAELGHTADQQRFAAIRTEFESDLVASLETAMQRHGIDYLPGCADLGDFDATSTTIALAPVGALPILPPGALQRTFEKYYEFFQARAAGAAWEAFTPYEIRAIGACVRLGWRARAVELLEYFLAAQRPSGWRQWPEVVWREPRVPHFLGDLPHTWVGSDYVRSVLDLLAYEDEARDALVIGAGIPAAWLRPAPGVVIRGLFTPHGPLGYTMSQAGDAVRVQIDGGLRVPPGGLVVRAPLAGPPRSATIDGRVVTPGANGEVVVHSVPSTVLLWP